MELRAEAAKWIKDVEEQERAFVNSLYALLDDPEKPGEVEQTGEYRGKPVPMPASWNPFRWERMDQINFAVTYGLTAIGLCLMLGFFTRLAALGGAAFMAFVVMTQPAFPTIYPPDPSVVGHALLVNKDFIELIALLVIAATGAGRWGGLDFFCRCWCRLPLREGRASGVADQATRARGRSHHPPLSHRERGVCRGPMNPTPRPNTPPAGSVNRRDFILGTMAAGAVVGGGLGAFYFGYDRAVGSPLRVGVHRHRRRRQRAHRRDQSRVSRSQGRSPTFAPTTCGGPSTAIIPPKTCLTDRPGLLDEIRLEDRKRSPAARQGLRPL